VAREVTTRVKELPLLHRDTMEGHKYHSTSPSWEWVPVQVLLRRVI